MIGAFVSVSTPSRFCVATEGAMTRVWPFTFTRTGFILSFRVWAPSMPCIVEVVLALVKISMPVGLDFSWDVGTSCVWMVGLSVVLMRTLLLQMKLILWLVRTLTVLCTPWFEVALRPLNRERSYSVTCGARLKWWMRWV